MTAKHGRSSQTEHIYSEGMVQAPMFNLKAVVNETGLKPDTLRAWERRYGLPQPDRTSGGHRLYSQHDVDMLKWLIKRQDEGMSISRAVELWRRIEDTGEDPLSDAEYGIHRPAEVAVTPIGPVNKGDALTRMREQWIEACADFDERRADSIVAQAFAQFPIETVCFELFQKGLAEIGVGWYEGRVTVQQEHFASALAIRRLETLVSSTPPPTRNGRILAACPPEERHTFSLLLLTLLLRRTGWDVVYLGANVPTDRISFTIATAKPHLVALTAQTLFTASTMLPMALLLQKERIPSAYGGAVFNYLPKLRGRMPGYFLGTRLDEVTAVVEQLMLAPPPMPMYELASKRYQVALDHYVRQQAAIESQVWQVLSATPDQSYLGNANKELGQNIIAALTFGDMALIDSNMAWIKGLLVNYHYRMPDEALIGYLATYYEAARTHLDERGAPVVDWLAAVLHQH